jgi:hypothetical protein
VPEAEIQALRVEMFGEAVLGTPPADLEYLLNHFVRVAKTRQAGFSTAQPLTWVELETYCRLYALQFEPWELDVIAELDSAFMRAASKARKDSDDAK